MRSLGGSNCVTFFRRALAGDTPSIDDDCTDQLSSSAFLVSVLTENRFLLYIRHVERDRCVN